MNQPPYLFIEKAFWLCPVHVFQALIFFFIGLSVGAAACYF